MYSALPNYVLFISLISSVNGAKFLNSTFLPIFSGCANASTHTIEMVTLAIICASI